MVIITCLYTTVIIMYKIIFQNKKLLLPTYPIFSARNRIHTINFVWPYSDRLNLAETQSQNL